MIDRRTFLVVPLNSASITVLPQAAENTLAFGRLRQKLDVCRAFDSSLGLASAA